MSSSPARNSRRQIKKRTPQAPRWPARRAVWVTGGVAVVLLVGAVYFGIDRGGITTAKLDLPGGLALALSHKPPQPGALIKIEKSREVAVTDNQLRPAPGQAAIDVREVDGLTMGRNDIAAQR